MTKGNANRLYVSIVFISLICAITDLLIEIPQNVLPMSDAGYIICNVATYVYLVIRNATNVVLLLFLLHLTQTSFILGKTWVKVIFSIPYTLIMILLTLNPLTHNVFKITKESGYARSSLMMVFYIVAFIYGIAGLIYCIYCRRYLPVKKWLSLLSIYVLGYLSVIIQFFYPHLLLEMFSTAIGELLIMLSIMRPEERMDSEIGILSWSSYKRDLKNIVLSKEHVQIVVIKIANSREIRNYLGDQKYNEHLTKIGNEIRAIRWMKPNRIELYIERPGTYYLITDPDDTLTVEEGKRILNLTSDKIKKTNVGVHSEMRICLIRCPEDLNKADEIISLGHKFTNIDNRNQDVIRADKLVNTKNFNLEIHIDSILDRAIKNDYVEMYYQPIYSVQSYRFESAEALVRIIDPEYGILSPGIFIPAAEAQGLIIPLGDVIMDKVFRFVSEHDLSSLGLKYIEMNLSVAQCLDANLPKKFKLLQEKYNVDPSQINLEITETTYEDISEKMLRNINQLKEMGYTFALDDYGTGYSNIQRVNHLPLSLVKIDKSVLDEISTLNGRTVLEYSMQMMQETGKQVVIEGAETYDVVQILENMGCDFIQGFFFSKPLPKDDFITFIKERNGKI